MREVRRLRQGKGWNQAELAFHAGLAPSVISEIETGKRDPNAGTLRKLASALDVDVPDLFERTRDLKAQAPLPFKEVEEEASAERRAREFMIQRPSEDERVWFIEKAVDILRHYHDLAQRVCSMMREDLAWHGSSYVWRGFYYEALQPAMERDGLFLHTSFIVNGKVQEVSAREHAACEKLLEFDREMGQLLADMYTIDDENNRRVREDVSRGAAEASEWLKNLLAGTPSSRGE